MKTLQQEQFYDLDIHPPEENNEGCFEIWQGNPGDRKWISIEAGKIPELIKLLKRLSGPDLLSSSKENKGI